MFSNRFESSSKIDFLASTDLRISDGCTTLTSNLDRKLGLSSEETIDADGRSFERLNSDPTDDKPMGICGVVGAVALEALLDPHPLTFSSMASNILMRSSKDGLALAELISLSLPPFELDDNGRCGLTGSILGSLDNGEGGTNPRSPPIPDNPK